MRDLAETKQIVVILERTMWNALLQCEGLPESVLHWPPPLSHSSSLFSLAVQILEGIEWWVLRPLGMRLTLNGQQLSTSSLQSFSELKIYYTQYMKHIFASVNALATSDAEFYVRVPVPQVDGEHPTKFPIRMCLLFALERSAVLVGQMQLLRQFFNDGECELQEITEFVRIHEEVAFTATENTSVGA